MSVLEIRSASASYRNEASEASTHEVLHQVSLTIETGRVTAILGPNGAGKTTLLNIALGWHRPDSGTVLIEAQDLASISPNDRGRMLSLVPQQDHIPFAYSILEYVLLGRAPYIGPLARPTREDEAAAMTALLSVGLDGRQNDGVLETSAGEKELVLLARSLAQDPVFLLLDEPSAHLDLANKRRLVELIQREAGNGRGVLLTVHEPEFAVAVADEVVLMRNGSVLASGPPDQVMTAALLTETYGVPVRVVQADERSVFLW
jgi:iron complex transport system ATP-binding protein